MIAIGGPPSRWVSKGGRPAPVAAGYRPAPGMPSYESQSGTIYVFDCLLAWKDEPSFTLHPGFASANHGRMMLLPRSYGQAAVRDVIAGGDGLCALHDDPDAIWSWRPLLYEMKAEGLQRLGSQGELVWRYGIIYAMLDRAESIETGVPFESRMEKANARADALLREHLDWHQQVDLEIRGHFYAAGEVNALYKIRSGDGFAIVDPVTKEELVSFCLHPETWMPDSDVALAILLLLQQGAEGEKKLLGGARPTLLRGRGRNRATPNEIAAYHLESEYMS